VLASQAFNELRIVPVVQPDVDRLVGYTRATPLSWGKIVNVWLAASPEGAVFTVEGRAVMPGALLHGHGNQAIVDRIVDRLISPPPPRPSSAPIEPLRGSDVV
jgi:hypothetical protein